MTYVVLARKYRPRNFGSLVGQPHVVRALVNALTQQRLHHAYLFTGTRGVGKTTISRILAKSLNCTGVDGQGGITAEPCGVCEACRDIDVGRYVDYVELDAASNRGVDEISQLLDQAVYKPVLGRFKVYMIDEVHMLSNHAFNAMLKTLEEPPDYLKFVLATTDPQKVPPTVLSRCLQFNLRPMAPQTVQEHLADVLQQEGIAADAAALRLLARAAHGSMRDGLSLTDQAIAFGAGAIEEPAVRQMLGAVDRGHALRLLDALARHDGAAVVAGVDDLRSLGLSAAATLEEMAALLQQAALQQMVPDAADADDPDAAAVAALAQSLAADETQLLYSIVLHGRAELPLAPDEYSGLVMVLLRMLAFPAEPTARSEPGVAPATAAAAAQVAASTATASVALRRAARLRNAAPDAGSARQHIDRRDLPGSGAAQQRARQTQDAARAGPAGLPQTAVSEGERAAGPPSSSAEPADRALGTRWAELVQQMTAAGRISALVRELALQAQCIAFDPGAEPPLWRLRVEREMLRAPAHCDKLEAALGETLGRPQQIEVERGAATDTPALRSAAERARRQAEAERIIHDDPLVQALMAQYKTARIVPGSVQSHSVPQEQQP